MKQLMDMINKAIDAKFKTHDEELAKKAEEERKKREEEAKKKNEGDDALKDAEEKVKQRKAAQNAEELEKERMLNAFKFNATVNDFIKDNEGYLPDNLGDILNILSAKTYASDVEKAQELKRAIVEQYIKSQDNINLLPDSLKAKAEKYAGFTTKEKLERAPEFYDIVETGIHTAKNIKKAEAIEKSSGFGDADDAVKEYENKMIEFSQGTKNSSDDK